MRPDPSIRAERQRTTLRRLVRERGPDTGRDLDHLKRRSQEGASEALLAVYDAGAVPVGQVAELSVRGVTTGTLLFMLDVSTLGGADTLE